MVCVKYAFRYCVCVIETALYELYNSFEESENPKKWNRDILKDFFGIFLLGHYCSETDRYKERF